MNFQMTLFRNKINLLDLMFSLSDGYLSAIIEALIFFVRLLREPSRQIKDPNG